MVARKSLLAPLAASAASLAWASYGVGRLEVAGAQRHLLAELPRDAAQPSDPQPVQAARREYEAHRAQELEPQCLVEVRLEREPQGGIVLAPHPVVVARHHAEKTQ